MIATSDSTVLMAMSTATNTGTLTRKKLFAAIRLVAPIALPRRPMRTKMSTGMTIEPTAPSGSRMKTLISIQVSRHSPLNIGLLGADSYWLQERQHLRNDKPSDNEKNHGQ